MTREEALQRIVDNNFAGEYGFDMQILIDCMVVAREIILNSQFPVEDCISRAEAIEQYTRWYVDFVSLYDNGNFQDVLKNLPSIQPKPKTGHWIIKEGREQGYDIAGIKTWYIQIMCDKCGFIKTAIEGHTGQYHFCPNCGAKMESEEV